MPPRLEPARATLEVETYPPSDVRDRLQLGDDVTEGALVDDERERAGGDDLLRARRRGARGRRRGARFCDSRRAPLYIAEARGSAQPSSHVRHPRGRRGPGNCDGDHDGEHGRDAEHRDREAAWVPAGLGDR